MFQQISNLKSKGYYPTKIFDIGAYHGNWTKSMLPIFPDCKYYLFEAIEYTELTRLNNKSNIKTYNVTLNDKIEVKDWFQMKNTGDSLFREKTKYFEDCEILKKTTVDLNTFIKNNNIDIHETDCIFIKIDCQGAEIPILKGATEIISYTDFILLEIPFFGQYNEGVPSFLEHIKYMDSIGFVPFDILDNHYINGFNMQLDILFINKTHEFNNIANKLLLR